MMTSHAKWIRRTAVASLALLAAGSCAQDPDEAVPTDTTDATQVDADPREWQDSEVEDVVAAYVEFLETGDSASADSLRCVDQRFGSQHAELLANTENLSVQLGGLAVDRAEVVDHGLDGWTVSTNLSGSESALNISIIEEEGTLKICGQSSPSWPDVRDALSLVSVTEIPMTANIDEVTECGAASGSRALVRSESTPSGQLEDGMIERVTTIWSEAERETDVRAWW